MRFAYEDLSDSQFERLALCICSRLLGIGVQGFAEGIDGGRDAKFTGTAQLHPSTASPWKGTTVIQAKHTNGYNRRFSESDFFKRDSDASILSKEIPRIRALRQNGELDHYMMFANRRLGANADADIRSYISTLCHIPESSIFLCGVEQLDFYMKRFPEIATEADLDPIDSPLIVSPDELAEVVGALGRQWGEIANVIDDPPAPRVSYEEKNSLNNMTAEYAKEFRKRYLKDTAQIRAFLAAPENADLQLMYESIADEFQLKIVAKRRDHQTFDDVLEYLIDLLFGRDPLLRQHKHKRLTRAVLFYMYWNCDIGKTDAQTN
jgi:hypothetical protein